MTKEILDRVAIFTVILILLSGIFHKCQKDSNDTANAEVPTQNIGVIPGFETQLEHWGITLITPGHESVELDMLLTKHTKKQLILEGVKRSDNLVEKRSKATLRIQQDTRTPDYYRGTLDIEGKGSSSTRLEKLSTLCYAGTNSGKHAYVYPKGVSCAP